MTLQLRPTFSESWYRVKNLRAKLRPGAQISRQYYRGDRWYVVRDPAGNQFHRLSDPAYRFVGLLDGTRTVEEAWDLCGGQLADDAPTQPEVIQILSHLYGANLIDADVTPDATVLLRRHKKLSQRKLQGRLMNVLFPRIPLWDPDRFLVRWLPLVRLMFSRLGALIWLAVVFAAVAMVAANWNSNTHNVTKAAKYAINLHQNPVNLLLLWGVFVFVKLIHELGHAFGCRRFGGECHELGIMFLVFIPTPYVDASTAWSFPNKWHRIFVGAAGMIVELFFAALCTFFWVNTRDPYSLPAQLAFNAMLVASVTTVIFNANPLLRYDGYYILSDWLEIPNLRQKSTEYALGLIKRHLFRVKATQPLPPPVQRMWLFTYAVASSIYRVFVGIMIIILVAFQIPILGVLMALGGVVTWILVPFYKTFKYLAIEPELHRKRGRATAYTLAFVGLLVLSIGIIHFPLNLDAVGVAQPAVREVVRAGADGKVEEIFAKDDQILKAGDPILRCVSPQIDAQIREMQANLRALELEQDSARVDGVNPEIYEQAIIGARRELDLWLSRREKLTLRARIDGRLVAPQLHEMKGQYLAESQTVAMVTQDDQFMIHTLMEQKDVEPVIGQIARDVKTRIRFAGRIGQIFDGGKPVLLGGAKKEDFNPVLTASAGTETAVDPEDPHKTQSPQFDIGVPLSNPEGRFVAGQRAHVRFELDRKPLIWQWSRRFWQLIQSQDTPWM
jgi:putative peptide zinc metalloprotease protein